MNFPSACCTMIQPEAQHTLFSLKRTRKLKKSSLYCCSTRVGICMVGGGGTAVHPVRTHCSTTALYEKGFSAGHFPGFNGKNEDILLLSALYALCSHCCNGAHQKKKKKIQEIDFFLKKEEHCRHDISTSCHHSAVFPCERRLGYWPHLFITAANERVQLGEQKTGIPPSPWHAITPLRTHKRARA